MAIIYPLDLVRGKTFSLPIRWQEKEIFVAKAISGISTATGFPRLTVPSHGVPQGWNIAVFGVAAPKQVNAKNNPPRDADYTKATVVDANTIELNLVIPVDDNGRDWAAYTSGGFVIYRQPRPLSGATARVKIKDRVGGTVLLSTEIDDAPNNLISATVDDTNKSITVEISASVTQALSWGKGVWEVEVESSAGKVDSLIAPSPVVVGDEVVTP